MHYDSHALPNTSTMDKSKSYIHMCHAAEEIQGLWQPVYGDFYADAKGQIRCWISRNTATVRFKKGYGIWVDNSIIHLSKYTWLPRQDQLIEMAQVPGRRYENIVQDFFDWSKRAYGNDARSSSRLFKTMEKIWLAFVMQQKFNRLWDCHTWVKGSWPA